MLEGTEGLDDRSRVRVTLGLDEGGSAVGEDGTFEFAGLGPGKYDLVVTYEGGLDGAAEGSAYRPYQRTVVAVAGAVTELGELSLQLGVGSVGGRISLGANVPAGQVRVRLLGADNFDVAP